MSEQRTQGYQQQQMRKMAEDLYRQLLNSMELRKWCIERAIEICGPPPPDWHLPAIAKRQLTEEETAALADGKTVEVPDPWAFDCLTVMVARQVHDFVTEEVSTAAVEPSPSE